MKTSAQRCPGNLPQATFKCPRCADGAARVVESHAEHTIDRGPTGSVTFRCFDCGAGETRHFADGFWVKDWDLPPLVTPPVEKPIPRASAFAWMVPHLTRLARGYGYALGLHGSMNRDLDLIAVPWVDDAKPAEELVEAIRAAIDGRIVPDGTPAGRWDPAKGQFVESVIRQPEHKPHGRRAWSIHFSGHHFYIDLSVMPRQA